MAYLEDLQKLYAFSQKARQEGEIIIRQVQALEDSLPVEIKLRESNGLARPDTELEFLLAELRDVIQQTSRMIDKARENFIAVWKGIPELVRWEFYAWLHDLEIQDGKLIAFIALRSGWPGEGILKAKEFPAWNSKPDGSGESFYLVGSMKLWKKKPPYLHLDRMFFAQVKVLDGILPKEPEDYIKCQKIEILRRPEPISKSYWKV